MTPLLINGMTKYQFAEFIIKKATKINPNWEKDRFFSQPVTPDWIWRASGDNYGFAISAVGINLFEEVLGITPYVLHENINISGDVIIRLDNYMPYPYYFAVKKDGTKVFIYSREVTVMAALYDNDLDKLLDMYELSRNS